MVVIMDLDGLMLGDFVNPMSVSSKLARLVVKLWQDYFSENVSIIISIIIHTYISGVKTIHHQSTGNCKSHVANS